MDTLTEKPPETFFILHMRKGITKQKQMKVAIQAGTLHHPHSASLGIHFVASFKCKYKTRFVKPFEELLALGKFCGKGLCVSAYKQ
jgi:hypothetical protein